MIVGFILLLAQLNFQHTENIKISVNGQKTLVQNTVEVYSKDTIVLSSQSIGSWYKIQPVFREYDNLRNGAAWIEAIQYELIELHDASTLSLTQLAPGTYLIGKGFENTKLLDSYKPMNQEHPEVVQLVIRENDSYIGYLTELLNLPFVIPPKLIPGQGHQTDLRIGTDCAELAIYGRRRMGDSIPYCGPRGINQYLTSVDVVKSGTVVHFGHQVSVVYQDLGKRGELDSDDLLIHAFEDKVSIQRFGDSSLAKLPYKLFEWKETNHI